MIKITENSAPWLMEQYDHLLKNPASFHVLIKRDAQAVGKGTSEHVYQGLERRLTAYLKGCRTEFEGIDHKEFGDRFSLIMKHIHRLQDGSEEPERIKRLKLAVMGTLLDIIGYDSWRYLPNADDNLFDIAESEYRKRQIEKSAAEPFYDA